MHTDEQAAERELFLALLDDKHRRDAEAHQHALESASASEEERERAQERARLEGSLAAFLPFAWDIYKPGLPFTPSWHYEYLAEYMQLVYERKILYLIVNVPPRTGKSFMLSIAFPAWVWAKDQLTSFIRASAGMDLSETLNTDCRTIIASPEYQALWGQRVQLRKGANAGDDFRNTRGGRMKAAAPEARITGHGGDIIIMDDILAPKDAESPVKSASVFSFVDETLLSRRNNLANSPIMLVEQRVGEADMTAHLLEMLSNVTHISIPLVEEQDRTYTFPVSGKTHLRPAGDVLMPSRFPARGDESIPVATRIQRSNAIKPHVFSTQYQGTPVSRNGKIFKREDFQFYGPKSQGFSRQIPMRREGDQQVMAFDEIVQSWDCTFKDLSKSDLVAGHVWGRKGPNKFLIDRHTERMNFVGTLKAIVAMRRKWPQARRILIEDKANGPAVISVLNQKIGGIIAVEPLGSKEARAEAASADVESHNVYLPDPTTAPWVEEFLTYVCAFPKAGVVDDDVDAMSQAILKMGQGATGIFGFYEGIANRAETPRETIFDHILATK